MKSINVHKGRHGWKSFKILSDDISYKYKSKNCFFSSKNWCVRNIWRKRKGDWGNRTSIVPPSSFSFFTLVPDIFIFFFFLVLFLESTGQVLCSRLLFLFHSCSRYWKICFSTFPTPNFLQSLHQLNYLSNPTRFRIYRWGPSEGER